LLKIYGYLKEPWGILQGNLPVMIYWGKYFPAFALVSDPVGNSWNLLDKYCINQTIFFSKGRVCFFSTTSKPVTSRYLIAYQYLCHSINTLIN